MTPPNIHATSSDPAQGPGEMRGYAACLVTLAAVGLLLAFTRPVASANPASRIATIDSLVHEHTFVIDNSRYTTIDRVVVDGHSYSSKPPVYSTLGAGVYWVLHEVTGLSLRADESKERDRALIVLTLLIAGLPYLALLLYAYRLICWMTRSEVARAWTFTCLALGQLGLAYSTTVNNHAPASALVVVAFYYAYGLRRGHLPTTRIRFWVYAGLAAGLAPTIDLGAALFSAGTGLYLLSFDWRRTLSAFGVACAIPLALHLGVTWCSSGSMLPIYLRKELYDYDGSWWRNPQGIDALSESRTRYFFNAMLGHHGLLSMTPTLIFSLIVMTRAVVQRDRQCFAEALAVGGPLIVLIVYYVISTDNYGGACAGFRWFMPAVPISLIFTARWLTVTRRRATFGLFVASLLVSQYHAFSSLGDPWIPSSWEEFLSS